LFFPGKEDDSLAWKKNNAKGVSKNREISDVV